MFFAVPCGTQSSSQFILPHYALYFKDENYGMYSSFWVALLSDSPLGPLPKRLIRRFYFSLVDNFAEVAKMYATLYDVFLSSLKSDQLSHLRAEEYLEFKHTPILREIIFTQKHFDPLVTQWILSFLSFGKRSPSAEPDALQATALRSWLEVENRLANLVLPDWVDDIGMIIEQSVAPYFAHIALPSHGPGKVAERGVSHLSEKHAVLHRDTYPMRVLTDWGRGVSIDKIVPATSTTAGGILCLKHAVALLSFVNKNVKVLRSICQEPADFMYGQKSVERALRTAINSGPFRAFTHLEDQSYNRIAAQWGSVWLTTDSLDLSAASDSLSLQLVKRVFPKAMLKYLLGTRSVAVKLPDGTIRRVYKFAPMGSAVCFPTQCIIFASVVVLAYYRYVFGEGKLTTARLKELYSLIDSEGAYPSAAGMRTVRVYGDDIICDGRVTGVVTEMLSQLGFVVNKDKSFTGDHPFRESCGGYYQDGYIVKPVSLKSDFTAHDRSLGAKIYSMVELAVRAYYAGYTHLAAIAEVFSKTWKLQRGEGIRCIYPGPGGLNYHGRYVSDAHVFFPISARKRRYGHRDSKRKIFNDFYREAFYGTDLFDVTKLERLGTHEEYHRDEGMYLSLKALTTPDQPDDVYGLVQWYRSAHKRSEGYTALVVQADPELNLRGAWKPL